MLQEQQEADAEMFAESGEAQAQSTSTNPTPRNVKGSMAATHKKIEDYMKAHKWSLFSDFQMEFDIMIFLALCNLPLKFIETDGFQYLISKLKPKANIKSESSFRKYKLANVHESLKCDQKKKLEKDFSHCQLHNKVV